MSPSLLNLPFLGLLLCVGLLRPLIPSRFFALFGAVASSLLIGLASPITLLISGGVSVLYLYPTHLIDRRMRRSGSSDETRRRVLLTSVTGLVAFMLGFKVYQHFTIPFLGGTVLDAQLAGLIGFSYFLFRAINFLYIQYLVDGRTTSLATLAFYSLFPPTLTSGPIQKFLDFESQVSKGIRPSRVDYRDAIYRITRGYFRKMVLAFLLNEAVILLLDGGSPTLGRSLGITTSLYLYFYFDFAGYSDIAIGFGGLLGVRVPENFKKPFTASTLTEFWRHWHITLVDWLRDHVFIPLGGMHASRRQGAGLALLIMVLCGLWHGLTPYFLLWGLWHGVHLALEAWFGIKPTPVAKRGGMRYWWKVAWTNARVAAGAVLFLPDPSDILFVLRGLLG
jgi:alginate O-acetyltransferase complex protein AlgI